MSITIGVLFAAIIKCSTAETNLNAFTKGKGGDRSLLQTMTNEDANSATSISCGVYGYGTYGTSPVFWRFDNPQRQRVIFSNCDTAFDSTLYVYDSTFAWISQSECGGDDCYMGAIAGWPFDGCGTSNREEFCMILDAGTYYIDLHPCCSGSGTYALSLTCSTQYMSCTTTPEPTQPTPQPTITINLTPEPTKEPTIIYDDLSNCNYVSYTSIPATDVTTNYWFTLSTSQNSIIGIDACDYEQGRNDFSFAMYLYPYEQNSWYSYTSSGNDPAFCNHGGGGYLEYQYSGYTNWRLKVRIYSSSSSNRMLQLTRKCEIKATTPLPTPFPTTPAPITPMAQHLYCGSRMQTTVRAGNVLPHYYLFDLYEAKNVRFQDCQTEFDPNLFVYDRNTMEELNLRGDCDGDDCGDCEEYPDVSMKEDYVLNLNPGEYFVMIRRCCSNGADATDQEYILEITCTDATSSPTAPTTPLPSPEPTPYPTPYPTTEMPSRSPLFPGETHPPTTAIPTRPPTTRRPTKPPTTKTPTTEPTAVPEHGQPVNYSVNYSVIGILFVGMVIGILFV